MPMPRLSSAINKIVIRKVPALRDGGRAFFISGVHQLEPLQPGVPGVPGALGVSSSMPWGARWTSIQDRRDRALS